MSKVCVKLLTGQVVAVHAIGQYEAIVMIIHVVYIDVDRMYERGA